MTEHILSDGDSVVYVRRYEGELAEREAKVTGVFDDGSLSLTTEPDGLSHEGVFPREAWTDLEDAEKYGYWRWPEP